jgi:hypothetical protein
MARRSSVVASFQVNAVAGKSSRPARINSMARPTRSGRGLETVGGSVVMFSAFPCIALVVNRWGSLRVGPIRGVAEAVKAER